MNEQFRWDAAVGHNVYQNQSRGRPREFIDFTSGIFAANVGHSNEAVCRAISDCLPDISFKHHEAAYFEGLHTYTYSTEIREKYEKKLCDWTGFEACHLFTTGSEAVEAALRVMGIDGGMIFAVPDAFHGKTYGPRMALQRWGYDTNEGRCEMAASIVKPVYDNWIIEGYRGWDAHFWEPEFVNHLKVCQEKGFLICFDEIQSGFGRTGRKFAYEWYDFKPDIVVVGKGSHSGFPGSGILGTSALLEGWRDDFSSTHGGNPLSCAAGLATIEEFERLDLINEAARKGEILHGYLDTLDAPGYGYSGRGLVAAVLTESTDIADRIVGRCRDLGLLVVHTGKPSVKIGPPLTIPDEALLEGLEILKGVLSEV